MDNRGELQHAMPFHDEIEHLPVLDCACGPGIVHSLDGTPICLHRPMDMRHLIVIAEMILQHTSAVLSHQPIEKNRPVQKYLFDSADPIQIPPPMQRPTTPYGYEA